MLANYLQWHYGVGAQEALARAIFAVRVVYNYFSIGHLFGSLIAPFHRDLPAKQLGFDPQVFLYSLAESAVSRVIGFLIRAFIIFWGLIALFFTLVGAILFYLGWLAAPGAGFVFILMGFARLF